MENHRKYNRKIVYTLILMLITNLYVNKLFSQASDNYTTYSTATGNPKNLNTYVDNDVLNTHGWVKTVHRNPANGIVYNGLQDVLVNSWSDVITLPFSFNFYGESVNSCVVSNNGLVSFTTAVSGQVAPSDDNTVLPSSALPNKTIACFWGDFDRKITQKIIVTNTFGTAPNRQFWVKWNQMRTDLVSSNTYGLILEETTNNIYFVDMQKSAVVGAAALTTTLGGQYNAVTAFTIDNSSSIALTSSSANNLYSNNKYYLVSPSRTAMQDVSYTSDALEAAVANSSDMTTIVVDRTADLNCEGSTISVSKAILKGLLSVGEDYELGTSFTDPVQLGTEITGYDAARNVLFTETTNFEIVYPNVEQLLYKDITAYYADLDIVTIQEVSYTSSDQAGPTTTFNVEIELETAVEVETEAYSGANPFSYNRVLDTTNPINFSWNNLSCEAYIPEYELQILRLYNTNESTDLANIEANIDWSKAASMLIEDGVSSINLNMIQGTGYYIWRVRPIGNFYEGGYANNKNWGLWMSEPDAVPTDGIFTIIDASKSYTFYYTEPEEDENWIHQKVFTEDNSISESRQYANGLGMLTQTQHRIQNDNSLLVTPSIYDYNARPSIQFLAVPVTANNFNYVENLVSNGDGVLYGPADFDTDTNYNSPESASGILGMYYSDANSIQTIPSAGGFPFSRVLFTRDGTNRPIQQGSTGDVLNMSTDTNHVDRTVKIYFTSASEQELVNVLGNEAPKDTTVYKTITVDQNGVINVSFNTFDGKPLISCLGAQDPDGPGINLEAIPNDEPIETIVEEVLSNSEIDEYTLVKSTKKFLNGSLLTVTYTITPDQIAADCGNYCSTCDYSIQVLVKNLDTDEFVTANSGENELEIAAGTCTSTSHSLLLTYGPLVGTYLIERIIKVNNENADGVLNEDAHQDAVLENVQADLDQLDPLRYMLEHENVQGFYDLLISDFAVPEWEVVYNTGNDVEFSTSCCDFKVPVEFCPPPACDGLVDDVNGNIDFESLLWEYLGYFSDPTEDPSGHDINRYFHNDTGASKYPLATNATFEFYNCCPDAEDAHTRKISLQIIITPEYGNYDHGTPLPTETCGSREGCYYPSDGTCSIKIEDFANEGNTAGEIALLASEAINAWFTRNSPVKNGDQYPYIASHYQGVLTITPNFAYGTCLSGTVTMYDHQYNHSGTDRLIMINSEYFGINRPSTADVITDFVCSSPSSYSTCNYNGDYDFGKGAFNALVQNMIDERGANNQAVYYCENLYNIWTGILLSIQDKEDLLSRDILQEFVTSAGLIYEGTTENKWIANLTAYKQFYANATADVTIEGISTIENETGIASTAWGADEVCSQLATEDEIQACMETNEWTMLYNYINSQSNIVDNEYSSGSIWEAATSCADGVFDVDCITEVTALFVDTCEKYCELRRESFFNEIKALYATSSQVELVEREGNCLADLLVENCKTNCGLTVLTDETSIWDIISSTYISYEYVTSVGTPLEQEKFQNAMTADFAINLEASCDEAQGYIALAEHEFRLSDNIADGMNIELQAKIAEGRHILTQYELNNMLDRVASHYNGFEDGWPCSVDVDGFQFLLDADCTEEEGHIECYPMTDAEIAFSFLTAVPIDPHSYFESYLEGSDVKFRLNNTLSRTSIHDEWRLVELFTFDEDCKQYLSCGPICFKWVTEVPEVTTTSSIEVVPCEKNIADNLLQLLDQQSTDCENTATFDIKSKYKLTCAEASNIDDHLTIEYSQGLHHYTLYYYDRKGNLVRTVPPKGVDSDNASRADIPVHTFVTNYQYNARGQMVYKSTPDAGIVNYYYNDLGQLRFSRNAQQARDSKYSYLKYDNLGRVYEAGQATICETCVVTSNADLASLANNQNIPPTGEDIIVTVYNDAVAAVQYTDANGVVYPQEYLTNRISYTYSDVDGSALTTDDRVITYYSYDPHGNVKWVIQDIPELGLTQIGFEYDLLSGKVTEVKYQEGKPDQYYHRYKYDADNRIKTIENSNDGVIWDVDATYEYYAHGPLQRVIMGEDKIQGLDYVYTLQGWLKGINAPQLDGSSDPGQDGVASTSNEKVAADAWGLMLNYHDGDFHRLHNSIPSVYNSSATLRSSLQSAQSTTSPNYKEYFNGFISNTISNNACTDAAIFNANKPMAGMYLYDELGRLIQNTFDFYLGSSFNNNPHEDYKENFGFDANGNITTVTRNGH